MVAGLACGSSGPGQVTPAGRRSTIHFVNILTLRGTASFLASDAPFGRGTATAGGRAAAAYLASECRRLGLMPLTNAGFTQNLPLTKATIVPVGTTIRAHALWPLERIVGVVNLDANAPAARPRSWRIAGAQGSALVELVRLEAQLEGWDATPAVGTSTFRSKGWDATPTSRAR